MRYKGVKLPTDIMLARELGITSHSISANRHARESSAEKYVIMKLGLLKKLNMPSEVFEELSKDLENNKDVYIMTSRHKHKVLMFLGLLHKAEIDAIKGV